MKAENAAEPAAAPVSLPPTRDTGLTAAEVEARRAKFGSNELQRGKGTGAGRLLARQFTSILVWVLVAAAVVSAVVGELADAIAIGAIVLLNAVVGFLQENRAENALSALRSMTAPRARALRDGRQVVVPAVEIVPGDLVLLEAGDLVPADARVVEAHRLSTNEASLTGESVPVEKRTTPAAKSAPLAERHDAVFMGTAVATGTGRVQVFATGIRTELGRISVLLATTADSETPLQARLARVGRSLILLCLVIVVVVAGLGLVRGRGWLEVFMSAVSLAVAAVPEGLPAIVTIALALGVQRMAARNALVRRLPAVETLGSATVICTDKTGTLTQGTMAVREVWGAAGAGGGGVALAAESRTILDAACACCDAELGPDGRTGTGDPTEIALLAAGAEVGIARDAIERERPRTHENPFDADRKRMSIGRADGVLYVKGAPELLFPLCRAGTAGADAANTAMAARGLRVLGVAVGSGVDERELTLLGLVGIADPPRPEAIAAIAAARAAGIRTVMITGDHPATAAAIARELGIVPPGEDATGLVHARATPEDKLQIVRSWKARGEVVAMTGDGVNDAPALREAHIGIAMGRTGTEVTREASDIVLADDNFATIVAAIREGRGIFDNIRKTLVYLLTGNAAELALMLAAGVVGWPVPLLPLHLLWINLVTDGLPALALVMDPPDPAALEHPPRPPAEPMLRRPEWARIVAVGVLEAVLVLAVFVWGLRRDGVGPARDLAFNTLVMSELLRAFAARSPTKLLWEVGVFTNLRLAGVVVLSMALQLALPYIPVLGPLFEISARPREEWLVTGLVALVPVSVLELAKLLRRRRSARGAP